MLWEKQLKIQTCWPEEVILPLYVFFFSNSTHSPEPFLSVIFWVTHHHGDAVCVCLFRAAFSQPRREPIHSILSELEVNLASLEGCALRRAPECSLQRTRDPWLGSVYLLTLSLHSRLVANRVQT